MKKIICLLLAFALILSLIGCEAVPVSNEPGTLEQQLVNESQKAAANQQNLTQKQPAPVLDWSNERDNLIKKARTFGSDPNKVSYIYLLTENGMPIGFYTVKGKVSSLNSFLVPDENIVRDPYFHTKGGEGAVASMAGIVVQQPDIDGSYGSNPSGIFFYTTDDTYVEWNGLYVLMDKPLKLSQPTLFVQDGATR